MSHAENVQRGESIAMDSKMIAFLPHAQQLSLFDSIQKPPLNPQSGKVYT